MNAFTRSCLSMLLHCPLKFSFFCMRIPTILIAIECYHGRTCWIWCYDALEHSRLNIYKWIAKAKILFTRNFFKVNVYLYVKTTITIYTILMEEYTRDWENRSNNDLASLCSLDLRSVSRVIDRWFCIHWTGSTVPWNKKQREKKIPNAKFYHSP